MLVYFQYGKDDMTSQLMANITIIYFSEERRGEGEGKGGRGGVCVRDRVKWKVINMYRRKLVIPDCCPLIDSQTSYLHLINLPFINGDCF